MNFKKTIFLVLVSFTISYTGNAQLSGPSAVYTGVNNTYTYSGFAVLPTWQVSSNATIVSTSSGGGSYHATVKFNSGTSGTVTFKDKTITLGSISVSVTCVGQPPSHNVSREEPGSITLSPGLGTNGTTNKWYTASTGGTLVHTGISYTANFTSTTTYWVSSVNGSCEGTPRVAVTATIKPKPVIQSSAELSMGSVMLSVSNNIYNTYSWRRNGVVIGTGSTVNVTQPGVYSVTVTKTGMTGSGTSEFLLERTIDAQPSLNMIVVNHVNKDGFTAIDQIEALPVGERQRVITYLGGLGNSVQTVLSQVSPAKKDLIQPVQYDVHGRQLTRYLPYVSNEDDGRFRDKALDDGGYSDSEQYAFYQMSGQKHATDSYPYSVTEIEPSPLGRLKAQTGAGYDWHSEGKKAVVEYLLNRESDDIRLWRVNSSGLPVSSSVYGDFQLQVSVTHDENGHRTRQYIDKLGRTVQQEVEEEPNVWMKTYYIYNDLGQLAFVLSPGAVVKLPNFTPTSSFLDQWAFRYKYDELGRMVESKAPLAAWVYAVYDELDRIVLTQDGNLRAGNLWAFVKYDRLGRAILTGTKVISSTRVNVQSAVNAQANMFEIVSSSATGYTLDRTYPTVTEADLLSVTYYDNYDFLTYTGWDAESHSFAFVPELGHTSHETRISGLPTGGKVRMVGSGVSTWLNAVQYYDSRYRPIQMFAENHLNGVDRTSLRYNDLRQLVETKMVHAGGETVTIVRKVEYDHSSRPTKIFQNINGASSDQLIAQYEYNELGQLVDKKLHDAGSGSFLQSVDFRYTIRGWLSSINNAGLDLDSEKNDDTNDYFGMELVYNNSESGLSNVAQYNGNISAIKYKGPGAGAGLSNQRSYKYTYDFADRLLTSTFQANSGTGWAKEVNALNEVITYDNNGNIKTLKRNQRKSIERCCGFICL